MGAHWGLVRARLPRRSRRYNVAIPGLPAFVHRQLHNYELENDIALGQVAVAYDSYRRIALRRGPDHRIGGLRRGPEEDWRSCLEDEPRTLLELALRSLSPRARRHLRKLVDPLDLAYQSWSLNDPFAPPDHPWWLRRIDGIE
ncbi:hypothetical protein GCM10022254_27410 [Actinomadura meridiana]|uniref:Uncharacterized protein n=1 Tax=Actinomadura meridiana TaxID=559626 RepID=A0ABP8C025_9ACTN